MISLAPVESSSAFPLKHNNVHTSKLASNAVANAIFFSVLSLWNSKGMTPLALVFICTAAAQDRPGKCERLEGTQRSISTGRDLPSGALHAFSNNKRAKVVLYL